MAHDQHRVISIAATTGKLGCVLMVGRKVECWRMYRRNRLGPFHAAEQTRAWIKLLHPEALVTENVGWHSRKTRRTIRNLHTIANAGREADLVVLTVLRQRRYKSKYDEAVALTKHYPEMAVLLPDKKRKSYEPEPHRMIYFEALSLLHRAYHDDSYPDE